MHDRLAIMALEVLEGEGLSSTLKAARRARQDGQGEEEGAVAQDLLLRPSGFTGRSLQYVIP